MNASAVERTADPPAAAMPATDGYARGMHDPGSKRARAPRIRPATGGDARVLSALMAEVYGEGRWFVGDGAPLPDALARRLGGLDPSREIFLVAERPAIVGWIEAHRYAPQRMNHVATFTLAVASDARGCGVGRTLLRALLPWAGRVGVRKLRLDVRADNTVARSLYESEGFVVEGIERHQVRRDPHSDPRGHEDPDASFEDNLIMARFL